MAKDPTPIVPEKTSSGKPQVTPNWEQIVYDKSRIEKWMRGEITLRELNAISGPEMLEMAIIGFQMYEQGRYHEARVIFEGLATLDPKEGYYRTALGAVFLAQDDLENAEYCFNQAIILNPKEIASYVNRGEVYLRKGKILEAAYDFKKAVELDPQNKDPLSTRARLLAAAALETLQKAEAARAAKSGKPAAAKGGATAKAAAPAAKASSSAKAKGKPAGKSGASKKK